MSNPLTEARRERVPATGALRCVLPSPGAAADAEPRAARPANQRPPQEPTSKRPGH